MTPIFSNEKFPDLPDITRPWTDNEEDFGDED